MENITTFTKREQNKIRNTRGVSEFYSETTGTYIFAYDEITIPFYNRVHNLCRELSTYAKKYEWRTEFYDDMDIIVMYKRER